MKNYKQKKINSINCKKTLIIYNKNQKKVNMIILS